MPYSCAYTCVNARAITCFNVMYGYGYQGICPFYMPIHVHIHVQIQVYPNANVYEYVHEGVHDFTSE